MDDMVFYTVFDPENEFHWTSGGTTTSNIMQATWFFTVELAQEGVSYACWDKDDPTDYVIMKHHFVSERLDV